MRRRRGLLWGGGVFLLLLLLAGLAVYKRPMTLVDAWTRWSLWRVGVRSGYTEVGGQRIHYFEGPAAKGAPERPLVLVHGLGARGEDWAPLMEPLMRAGFHVYVPDLLGYGRSARPDVRYTISMEEGVVRGFMDAMHLGQADVAGWSMGGWVSMLLTLEAPERVRRLVLFDAAGVYFGGYTDLPALFAVHDVPGARRLVARLTPHPPALPDFMVQDFTRRMGMNRWVLERSLSEMMTGRDLLDFRLYALRQPTLIVWGKQDDLIPLSAGEALHRRIAGSSMVVLDGCGHLAPSECSGAAAKATVAFLDAEPARRDGDAEIPGRPRF